MTKPTYTIRHWNRYFENSQSRKLTKMSWVPIPNKHDGKSFRRIMQRKNGAAIYGVWVLLVQVASKCPKRGTLADEDGPLDSADISVKIDVQEKLVLESLEVLTSQGVAWIMVDSPTVPVESGGLAGGNGREQKGTEGKGKEDASCAEPDKPDSTPQYTDVVSPFPVCDGSNWPVLTKKLAEWTASFPHLDVPVQLMAARQWCLDNPAKQKTANGMSRFIGAWLTKEQNRGGGRDKGKPTPLFDVPALPVTDGSDET